MSDACGKKFPNKKSVKIHIRQHFPPIISHPSQCSKKKSFVCLRLDEQLTDSF